MLWTGKSLGLAVSIFVLRKILSHHARTMSINTDKTQREKSSDITWTGLPNVAIPVISDKTNRRNNKLNSA